MKTFAGLALLQAIASASPLVAVDTIHNGAAPILSSTDSVHIPHHYMVVFKDHVTPHIAYLHHGWVMDLHGEKSYDPSKGELRKRSGINFSGLKHTFDIADKFRGYSGNFNEETIEEIRRHPDVEYIERDSEVRIMPTKDKGDRELEKNAPWGLARISHRDGLSFSNFNQYLYSADGGEGVDVYVIDTGTHVDHVDFEGRASWGATIPEDDDDDDGNGHGTHCSGTVAGRKYGVAKKAHIKAVKVLRSNGSGSMSDVVKGVEYAAQSHQEKVKAAKKGKKKGFKGSTANMSLGGGKSSILDRAVNAAVDAGIHFAVAAGNENSDSCNSSPAAAEKVVTVGASTLEDTRAYFSNFGTCNDIFAPGLNIVSTWIGSDTAINIISGTSMASPHIAGLLAYLLSLQPAKDSEYAVADIKPNKLKAELLSIATRNALDDVPEDTANLLAWNGGGSSNYSEIIAAGGYDVATTFVGKADNQLAAAEDFIEERMKSVKERVTEIEQEMEAKLDDITSEIEDFMESELHDF